MSSRDKGSCNRFPNQVVRACDSGCITNQKSLAARWRNETGTQYRYSQDEISWIVPFPNICRDVHESAWHASWGTKWKGCWSRKSKVEFSRVQLGHDSKATLLSSAGQIFWISFEENINRDSLANLRNKMELVIFEVEWATSDGNWIRLIQKISETNLRRLKWKNVNRIMDAHAFFFCSLTIVFSASAWWGNSTRHHTNTHNEPTCQNISCLAMKWRLVRKSSSFAGALIFSWNRSNVGHIINL